MELNPMALARPFLVETVSMVTDGFALPAGTVTFLLTDVEGSTRLWETRQPEMGPAIARHYAILDEAIDRFHGVRPVEQGEGDSVVAAFARAVDAVQAALYAQLALQHELPWLRVRMAIHTGEAQLRDEGNYVGRTIIRCARLRSCGHGGQILISETAAPLVIDAPPLDVSLVDLGVARLRDLSRSERVWQLAHPDLALEFPPLRTLDVAPNNLPTSLTSFVGRDEDQQTLADLVTSHRLVTVTGSGGAGKTRLALQVAAGLAGHHGAGTWWVELAPSSLAAEVPERVAAAIGLAVTPGVDPLDTVVRHCREGDVLLVLDNAEHLVEAVAATAQRLLATCPPLRLLVTSREPLGVPGEILWRIPSLAVPAAVRAARPEPLTAFDSVRLFIERAREARPNLVIDDEVAPHLAEICARLDGIPLAIELAAARTRSMTIERIAAELHDAFRLLTGGARTVLPRQQTLRASIAWSVDALDETERTVFRRLSVFQAPFTLDAAEAVAAEDDVERLAVLDVVARLVDKSLVRFHDDTGRYSLLVTLRQFGLDQLRETAEIEPTRRRHAEWYATWSEAVGRGVYGLTARAFLVDVPDLVAALEWSYQTEPATAQRIAAGIGLFGAVLGMAALKQLCDWLAGWSPRTPEWAAAIAGIAPVSFALLRPVDLLAVAADAREVAADDDRRSRHLLTFLDTFRLLILHGDIAPMTAVAAEARDDGDDVLYVTVVGMLAATAVRTGDFPRAEELLADLRQVLARHGTALSPEAHSAAFLASIELAIQQGRFDDARHHVALAEHGVDVGWGRPIASVQSYLGFVSGTSALLTTALAVVDDDAPPMYAALRHYILAFAAMSDDRSVDAADHALRGFEGLRGNGVGQGFFVPLVPMTLLACGRVDDARQHLKDWTATVDELGRHPMHVAVLHQCSAIVHLATGDDAAALDHAHLLLELAHDRGYALFRVDALEAIADAQAKRGNEVLAARLLGAARAERDRIGYAGRWRPDPEAVTADHERLAGAHPDASAEGRALSMAEAVELAGRSRSQPTRATHGWDSLTPTERRVVDLVADGLSNADIAGRLLMSVPTVKSHLTHVFTKLDMTNRTELAAAASQRRSTLTSE